ncbi:MAG: D-galactarate dehydratase [Rhodobacteraceae bacterium]|nr:D-galactarate dehydratase [Paracoccaceae bacterium]
MVEPVQTLDPTPPPPPPASANTAEAFDTTSEADRVAALAPPEPAGEQRLGTTIGSLGNPGDPGIWIETALVTELVYGRAEVTATGNSINLELRPSGGEAGSGSQISLPAMRLLQIPFTDLPELILYELPGGAPA